MKKPNEPFDLDSKVSVTLMMRLSEKARDYGAKLLSGSRKPLSREEAEELTTIGTEDRQAVFLFIQNNGLQLVSENPRARTVCVTGTIKQMNAAFGVHMRMERDPGGQKYLGYEGHISLPPALKPIVEAVLGLNGRSVAKSHVV